MKRLLILLALLTSGNAFADSRMVTVDAYKLCPSLDRYVTDATADSYDVENCITAIEGKKFQLEVFEMCMSLPRLSTGYPVYGHDVTDCLKKIAGKTYPSNRIQYCKNLKFQNYRDGYPTLPSDVYNCLK